MNMLTLEYNYVCIMCMCVHLCAVCYLCMVAGYLVTEFTKFWFNEKPKDVMEFSRIRDKFYRHIVSLLKDPATVLRADFQEH